MQRDLGRGLGKREFVALAVLACMGARSQPDTSFDLRVPVAPMVRLVDGIDEVVYELHLDNHALVDLKPLRIEVRDGTSDRVLTAYEGAELDRRLDRSGVQWKSQSHDTIASGRRGVLFIEIRLTGPLPRVLQHRVTYTEARAGAAERWIDGGSTAVVAGRTPQLSPPLRGGPWTPVPASASAQPAMRSSMPSSLSVVQWDR